MKIIKTKSHFKNIIIFGDSVGIGYNFFPISQLDQKAVELSLSKWDKKRIRFDHANQGVDDITSDFDFSGLNLNQDLIPLAIGTIAHATTNEETMKKALFFFNDPAKQLQASSGVFTNPNITDELVELILAQPNYVMHTNMICSANLSQARIDTMIEKLDTSFFPQVFSSLIRNPNLNSEQIVKLIHLNVNKGNVENFSNEMLGKLSSYDSDELDLLLSMNGDSTAVPLLYHPNLSVKLMELYAHHPSAWARKQLARNPNLTEDVMNVLSNDQNASVLASLAENPNAPKPLLEKLFETENKEILMAFARRVDESSSSFVRALAYHQNSIIRASVSVNPLLQDEDILSLIQQDGAEIAKLIAMHQYDLSDEVIKELLKLDDTAVTLRLINHQDLNSYFTHMLASHPACEVRYNIALTQRLEEDDIIALADDEHPPVAMAIRDRFGDLANYLNSIDAYDD